MLLSLGRVGVRRLCRCADVLALQAEITDPSVAAELKKKRTFRTFSYRGVELDKLLDLSNEEVRFSTLTAGPAS